MVLEVPLLMCGHSLLLYDWIFFLLPAAGGSSVEQLDCSELTIS